MIVLITGQAFSQNSSPELVYFTRYKLSFFGNPKLYLETFDLQKKVVIDSRKIDSGVSSILLQRNGNLLFLFREEPDEFKRLHEIVEYNPRNHRSHVYIKHESATPQKALVTDTHQYFLFDNIIGSKKYIQKHPKLVPYQMAGVEVYSNVAKPILTNIIRMGEFDWVEGLDLNRDKTMLYLTVYPMAFINKQGVYINNNNGESFLYTVDLKSNKIIQKKNLSHSLRGIESVKTVGEKLYITALFKNTHKHTYGGEDPSQLNKDLFVFNAKTLKLIKKFHLEGMARDIYSVPEDHRLFVFHEGTLGSNQSAVTVVDTDKDKSIGLFNITKLRKISYVGCH